MGKAKNGTRYPEELLARAARMVSDHDAEYASRSAAILLISQKVGCSSDSLSIWVKQHETDTGKREGMTTAERDRIKELERENRQLRQANEILCKASAELDRPFRKCLHSSKTIVGSMESSQSAEFCNLLRRLSTNGLPLSVIQTGLRIGPSETRICARS